MAYYDMVGYFRGYSTDQYSRGKYVMKSGNRQRGLEVIFSPTRSDKWGYRVQFLSEYRSRCIQVFPTDNIAHSCSTRTVI